MPGTITRNRKTWNRRGATSYSAARGQQPCHELSTGAVRTCRRRPRVMPWTEREAIVLPRCRPTRPTGLDTSPLALQSPSTPWSSKGKLSPLPSPPSQAGRWSAREQHHRQAEHVGGEEQAVRACERLWPLLEERTRPRCDQVNWSQIREGHGRPTLQDDPSSPLAS